jgi:hypothetical protein
VCWVVGQATRTILRGNRVRFDPLVPRHWPSTHVIRISFMADRDKGNGIRVIISFNLSQVKV